MDNKELVLEVEATEEEMEAVCEFVDELLDGVDCFMEARTKLDMAVEEIFVNIASYAYGSKVGKAVIRGSISPEPPYTVTLVFEDSGKAFNPLEQEASNFTPAIRRRTVGGLGIFLARSMADEISYERRQEKNILTIKKDMVKA